MHASLRGLSAASVLGIAVAVGIGATACADASTGGNYVALGDSYASAPDVPTQIDANCQRSDHDYAHVAAAAKGLRLTDATCGGATTATVASGQFAALSANTNIVTLTVGGNDIGFSDIVKRCTVDGLGNPTGDPCKTAYAAGGDDPIDSAIAATAPKIAGLLQTIASKAPHAKVFVVGYPRILPADANICQTDTSQFALGDIPWLDQKEQHLDSMLQQQSDAHGAHYVDVYPSTDHHDSCEPFAQRWVNGLQTGAPYYGAPDHPNLKGEAAMAAALESGLSASS